MDNNAYYILIDGEQQGPYTFDEIVDMEPDIHTRILSPLADNWHDACDLPEFYEYFVDQGITFPTEDNLASFWWRLLAFFIDLIILSFVMDFAIVLMISKHIISNILSLKSYYTMPYHDALILQLVLYTALLIYNSTMEASGMKATIGKRICRLVVVDQDGQQITFLNSLLRSLLKAVSMFFWGVGFLSVFWSDNRQALHDLIAKTYVIRL